MRDLIVNLSFDEYGPLIAKEINELEENEAPIQKAMILVAAREACLCKLETIIETISFQQKGGEVDEDKMITHLESAQKLLITLRYLSLDTVEAIVRWRERLAYLASKVPMNTDVSSHDFVFVWDSENYLLRMKQDTLFLKDSCLKNYLNFSQKADPFLLTPSQNASTNLHKNVTKKGGKKRIKVPKIVKPKVEPLQLEIDYEVVKRIKDCELVLIEEAVCDYTKYRNLTTTTGQTDQSHRDDGDNKMIENEPNPEPVTNDNDDQQ